MHSLGPKFFLVRRIWRRGGLIDAPQPLALPTRDNGEAERHPWNGHTIDLRASVPLPGGRWYFTVVAGPERRSADRLKAEGQTHWLRRVAVYMMLMSLVLWLVVCAIVLLYLAKSALGLDLFSEESPFHFLYERWLESRA